MTGTAQFQVSNYTVDDPSAYRAKLDGNGMLAQPIVAAFQVYQRNPASMMLNVAPGAIPTFGTVPAAVAGQVTPVFIAPTTNPRNDIVCLNPITGAIAVATGAEAGAPTDPLIDGGMIALARVRLPVGMTAITNPDIDDLRTGIVPHPYFSTGDVKLTLKTVADSGWVMCDDGTIGNASSGATTRANRDTEALFALLWNNVSNVYAPLSGGRGTDALSDFSAGKTIGLTKMLGRALALAGSGSGLTMRSLGQIVGEETHTDTQSEMPGHTHVQTIYAAVSNSGNVPIGYANVGSNVSGPYSTQSSGGGGAHNNMQPTVFLNAMIKL